MEQISRPFQIALIAVLGLSMVWFVALRNHGSSSTATPPPITATPAPAPSTASSHASPSAASSSSEAGEGYSSAIDKAHGAVTESQQKARQLENRSAQASNEAVPAHGVSTTPKSSSSTARTTTSGADSPRTITSQTSHAKSTAHSSALEVQHEIAQGDTVILLFWNPKAVADVAVHKQLDLAKHALGHKVVIHDASASQIGIFGQVTQDVTVYQTPTILIINHKKLVTTLTGFTDAFSITQAVREARK